MSPADVIRRGRRSVDRRPPVMPQEHIIHALVVVIVIVAATFYATQVKNTSDNVWIVYGSAIGYAAGRSGSTTVVHGSRDDEASSGNA